MENNDLLRRAEDLQNRCERSGRLCASGFLSPAEGFMLENWAKRLHGCKMLLHGGHSQCERKMAFFLPEYMSEDQLEDELSEHICAISLKAHFGQPGHRDYMGALLGMGIGRQWLGDIWVKGDSAVIFCQNSVERHLLSIDKVGRYSVSASHIGLEEIEAPQRQVQSLSFSVMSLRLDAVVAGMFKLSRTEAAKQIAAGNVSLNYTQCFKCDYSLHEGDVISLRGAGKGSVTGTGGTSRKGRLFVYADVYV